MTAKATLTYADYAALDDGKRYELLDGELYMTPSPSGEHQLIVSNLVSVLDRYVRSRRAGVLLFAPLDVIFADTTVAQPDIIYLEDSRRTLLSRRGIEGAPTLAVEVLSPSTTSRDRRLKFALYARFEVPFYWIVDPVVHVLESYTLMEGRYVEVLRASGRTACGPPPFEDLALVVDDLWPEAG
jgi:Uma2 family endonuclease